MARRHDDGRIWDRVEIVDPVVRMPGRRRRAVATVVGLAAVGAGIYLGAGAGFVDPAPAPAGSAAAPAAVTTCASVGINLVKGRYPAEGVPESAVVRLFRADRDGTARLLVPQAFVLKSSEDPRDGSLTLSVVIRSGAGDGVVTDVNGANAEGSLSTAVLYDVDPGLVLDECRR